MTESEHLAHSVSGAVKRRKKLFYHSRFYAPPFCLAALDYRFPSLSLFTVAQSITDRCTEDNITAAVKKIITIRLMRYGSMHNWERGEMKDLLFAVHAILALLSSARSKKLN